MRFAGKLEASGFVSARPVVETWRKRLGVNFSVLPACFWEPGRTARVGPGNSAPSRGSQLYLADLALSPM